MLSGTPPGSVTAGEPYVFVPTVGSDGETEPVFMIDGLPHWAGFNATTGALYGTPGEADVGVYESVTISATNGAIETSLPPFSIAVGTATGSVTLSWTPPTENEDGSLLVDLAGYWIYWRNTADTVTESMKIDNPGVSMIVIDNLVAGTYEFAMTSYNAAGIESVLSNTVIRVVGSGVGAGEDEDVVVSDDPVWGQAKTKTLSYRTMSRAMPPESLAQSRS
jgi:hypothetical protein